MFEVVFSRQAEKFYNKADDKLIFKINQVIQELSVQPFIGNNIKKLRGYFDGMYRYRIGDYRIVYSVENSIKIISVIWIGKRKDAY
jgi:mRNA interferase RelE/StbE